MKRYIQLLTVFALFLTTAQAQTQTQKLSLKEAVDYARKYNYTILNNKLDVEAAEKKVKEVLASGLPQINASGNFTNNTTIASNAINFGGNTVIIKFGQPYNATGSISGSQLLFDGSFLMGVKAAKEFVEFSRINMHRTEIETEVTVTKAYCNALLMQTNVLMLDTTLLAITTTKNDMEKRYAGGMIEKTDLDRVVLQYSSVSIGRQRAALGYKLALMVLKLQVGLNESDSLVLTDNLQSLYTSLKPPVVETKIDFSNRIEYKMINQQLKLYNFEKKAYTLGYAPSLVGVAATQRNSFGESFSSLGNTWYAGTYWGLNLSVPIFDGLRKSAKIQQTKINIQKAENDRRQLESLISQQITAARTSFELASQQVAVQEANLRLAQEIYDRVQIKLKNGLSSSLELVTAQNDLANARQNYLSTIYEYFSAQVELKKAVGEIK